MTINAVYGMSTCSLSDTVVPNFQIQRSVQIVQTQVRLLPGGLSLFAILPACILLWFSIACFCVGFGDVSPYMYVCTD